MLKKHQKHNDNLLLNFKIQAFLDTFFMSQN